MFDLQAAKREARRLDRLLIRRRIHIVRRNLTEIEKVNRSPKYIQRLAGGSAEDIRRSRTEAAVEWFAAAAADHPDMAARFQAFWIPLFESATPVRPREFWQVYDEIESLLGAARQAFTHSNVIELRFVAVKIKEKAKELLVSADIIQRMKRV